MTLSKEQQDVAISHLNSKWQNKACTVCKGTTWDIHPQVYELRQFNEGNMVLGGPLVPLLVLECKNCGNTILINAIRAGVVSASQKQGGENVG